MGELKDMVDEAKKEVTRRATEKMAEDALAKVTGVKDDEDASEEERAANARKRKQRGILMLVGGTLGVLIVISLIGKLLKWAIALAVLGGVGYGVWRLIKPRIEALGAARRERQALLEAKRAEEAALQAEADKKQALEDQLAAMKAQVDD
jgi:Flp pilus assembly protein TadB